LSIVDISKKSPTYRRCIAEGFLKLKPSTLDAIKRRTLPKGDPIATAQTAALLAIKKTPTLIPHCHPLRITYASVRIEPEANGVRVLTEVAAEEKTGVEIEALVGTAIALVTLWDLVKSLEKDERGQYPTTAITEIKVITKEKVDVASGAQGTRRSSQSSGPDRNSQ